METTKCCVVCGKEIPFDSETCSYCGAIQKNTNTVDFKQTKERNDLADSLFSNKSENIPGISGREFLFWLITINDDVISIWGAEKNIQRWYLIRAYSRSQISTISYSKDVFLWNLELNTIDGSLKFEIAKPFMLNKEFSHNQKDVINKLFVQDSSLSDFGLSKIHYSHKNAKLNDTTLNRENKAQEQSKRIVEEPQQISATRRAYQPTTYHEKQMAKNIPHCPHCGSTNVDVIGNHRKKFSTGKAVAGMAIGVGFWTGFLGKKGKKYDMICMNCGKKFKHKF